MAQIASLARIRRQFMRVKPYYRTHTDNSSTTPVLVIVASCGTFKNASEKRMMISAPTATCHSKMLVISLTAPPILRPWTLGTSVKIPEMRSTTLSLLPSSTSCRPSALLRVAFEGDAHRRLLQILRYLHRPPFLRRRFSPLLLRSLLFLESPPS